MNDNTTPEPSIAVPAATVLLVRDTAKNGIEVFMVKRTVGGAFSGLYVFPGGKVDECDKAEQLLPYITGIDNSEADRILSISAHGLSYWVACVRECFEEAGILLAKHHSGEWVNTNTDKDYALYRDRLNNGEDILKEMCEDKGIVLDLGPLCYLSHWITPKIEKRRFTTRFFIAGAPPNQEASHDGAELVNSLWISPKEALRQQETGDINMILPTINNLKDIADFDSIADMLATKKAIAPQDIQVVAPVFAKIDGDWVRLAPDDPRYKDYA